MQNQEILQNAADQARGLAIDAIHACSSGHLGFRSELQKSEPFFLDRIYKLIRVMPSGSIAIDSSSLQDMAVCFSTDGYIRRFRSSHGNQNFRQLHVRHQDILNLRNTRR